MKTTPKVDKVKLHKIPEVADLLGISRKQVYRLIDQGEIVRVKLGTKLARITDESLVSYIGRREAA